MIAERAGRAIALRVTGLDQPAMLEQWWNMMRATNVREFETAVRPLQVPIFTIIYADRDGRIMHLFGGRTPVRPRGDYNWSGTVPGDSARTLWTATHPYEELPRVLDHDADATRELQVIDDEGELHVPSSAAGRRPNFCSRS